MATPLNIFDSMMAQGAGAAGQQPPVPPPRQYMTPGMSDYVMGQDGAPIAGAPPIASGASMAGNTPQPLPPPDMVGRQRQGIGPQMNQGIPQRAASPLARPTRNEDPNRRRTQIGGY
jgi:hypothetical protein